MTKYSFTVTKIIQNEIISEKIRVGVGSKKTHANLALQH
jgi:hypothetical protein